MYFEAINLLFEAEEVAAESSLFSPDQFAGYAVTALLTAVNVLVAYIVIKKFIFKPIVKMIHNREEALNGELDAAAKSKEEAERLSAVLKVNNIDSDIVRSASDTGRKTRSPQRQAHRREGRYHG